MNIKAFALTTLAATTLVAAPAQAAQQFTTWNQFTAKYDTFIQAEENANAATYCQIQKETAELIMNNYGLAPNKEVQADLGRRLRINLEDIYQYCAEKGQLQAPVKPNAGYAVQMNFTEKAWGQGMRKDDYNCGKYGAQTEQGGFGTNICTFTF